MPEIYMNNLVMLIMLVILVMLIILVILIILIMLAILADWNNPDELDNRTSFRIGRIQ
ncbi:MAG: hypothetical protein GX754_09740 [Clostridiaceae bacterium]|nr:hypothetical protein [Clostridiaceae bacterium]